MKKRAIRKRQKPKLTLKLCRTRITPTALAKLLSEASGGRIDPAVIRFHVAGGAPADKRGRLRLIDYAAWLNQQLVQSGEK